MSKVIFVALREKRISEGELRRINKVCDSLNPDNIDPTPTTVLSADGMALGISNPARGLKIKGINILFGTSFEENNAWDGVNEEYPDGNYAIFRANGKEIEVVSDILGTRSVWYYTDEKIFIASTSQRAIIMYLENFEFNKEVIPWMLSNGLLGPGLSWDRRLSLLPPDSSLRLDRVDWTYKIHTREVRFTPNKRSDKENIKELTNILKTTFSELDLDYSLWNLTLSGGYDSRGNLCLLPKKDSNGKSLKTVTWGFKESEKTRGSDAYIAKKLAAQYNLQHTFFRTDNPAEPLELILDRLLKNGEGRIDHIGGYMDGFAIWKTMFENKISGTIRGDEVFGSYDFVSDFHLKRFIGLSLCSDYENLKSFPYLNSISQAFPERFEMRKEESREVWRDRLYQSYLVPIYLSALADLKQGYTEQINPFLSKKVVSFVRELPDHLRTDKKAFRQIVDSLTPKIGYAKSSATYSSKEILEEEKMVNTIRAELESPLARSVFPEEFISSLLSQLVIGRKTRSWTKQRMAMLKAMIPKSIKRQVIKKRFSKRMDMNLLAFRAFMVVKMIRIFEEDLDTMPGSDKKLK